MPYCYNDSGDDGPGDDDYQPGYSRVGLSGAGGDAHPGAIAARYLDTLQQTIHVVVSGSGLSSVEPRNNAECGYQVRSRARLST